MKFFGIEVTLEPSKAPTGRRLEDIESLSGIEPTEVDEWLRTIVEDNRRSDRQVSLVICVLCVPAFIALLLFPEEWNEPLDIGRIIQASGLFFVALGGVSLLPQLRVRFWPRRECRVLATSILASDSQWAPAVLFEYEVDGVVHRSHRLTYAGPTGSVEEADAARRRFSPGERRRCYVDPRRPGIAVLDKTVSYANARVMATLGLAALLFGRFYR